MLSAIRLVLPITIILFFSCSDNKAIVAEENDNVPTVFAKLVGTWKNIDTDQFEKSDKINDTIFTSVVFSIKANDTIRTEEGIIYAKSDQWVFENKVSDQNKGKSVQFVSSILTDRTIQFTNPAHDSPVDIHYNITDPCCIKAFITGPGKKAKTDTINLNYKRVKD